MNAQAPEQQLALLELPAEPKLTDRQQAALTIVQANARDGIDAHTLGAQLGSGRFARENGMEVLRALAKKGLVRRDREWNWRPTVTADDALLPGMTDEIPY